MKPISWTTIHQLIYDFYGKSKNEDDEDDLIFGLKPDSMLWEADLLILDECSMVPRQIAKDLASFGRPILVIGDPAQLPPVKGMEHYIDKTPDALLTKIHRQAGGNPILEIADRVRRGLPMPSHGDYGTVKVIRPHDVTREILLDANVRLVGKNQTRHLLNDRIRALKGYRGDIPNPGETVVCLRNNYDLGVPVFNGSLWTVLESEKRETEFLGWHYQVVEMEIRDDLDETVPLERRVTVTVEGPVQFFFGLEAEVPDPVIDHHQEFAYGYALTVHKSQGSEWDKVILLDQPVGYFARWRYTGITRAAKELVIVR